MKKNLSFQNKIIGSFVGIMMISLVMGAAGEFAVHRLNVQVDTAFTYFVPSTDFLIQADRDLQQLLVAERTLISGDLTEEQKAKQWDEVNTNKKQFETRVSKYEALAKSDREKEVMKAFWEDHKKWEAQLAKTRELIEQSTDASRSEARALSLGAGAELFENMRERLNVLQDYLGEQAVLETKASEEIYRASSIALAGCIVLSLFVILGIYFGIVRKVTVKLTQFVNDLTDVVTHLGHETSTVGTSSKRLSSSVSNQASSVDQTVTALDEINAMVTRNTETCEQSGVVGRECEQEATRGQTIVRNMIQTIEMIGQGNRRLFAEVESGNKEMERIVGLIREIEERAKVINDIVFQTKLLSFNASVEAARAGVHGKGFSLVAEEVGKLAAVTGSAADEITGLIENSVKQVEEIVHKSQENLSVSVKSSDETLKKGIDAASQCDEALRSIVEKVTKSNMILDEVNRASKEQSAGIREINEAIQNIDMITKENADLASGTESVVTELESQSRRLGTVAVELEVIVQGKSTHIYEEADEDLKAA